MNQMTNQVANQATNMVTEMFSGLASLDSSLKASRSQLSNWFGLKIDLDDLDPVGIGKGLHNLDEVFHFCHPYIFFF